VTASGVFLFGLAFLQLLVAGYGLAAALSWRGERLWPAPGHPLGRVPVTVAVLAVAAAAALLLRVGDLELARYLGTGAVLLAGLPLLGLLLRRQSREG
jgi:hypothetical protein